MRLTYAFLVVVDISGYTSFITQRTVSLLHAEQIITELMEAMIDRTAHPLLVNKLEGDAALLYAECAAGDMTAARDIFAQVKAFFPAFHACLARQREQRANCSCEACTRIDHLDIKAFVHVGEIAIKRVLKFEELAGEEVILVHRLLKNRVPSRQYVLMSEAARAAAGLDVGALQSHPEVLEGVGEVALWLAEAASIPFDLPESPVVAKITTAVQRIPVFHHLEGASAAPRESPLLRFRRWLGRS